MGFSVLSNPPRGVSESERANLINRKVFRLPEPSLGESETRNGNKLMVYDGMKNAFPNRKQVFSKSYTVYSGSDLEVKSQV